MTHRPRVKVCGLRRVEDAQLAIEFGATHLGCVVAPDSPRCATFDEVRAIVEVAGELATMVLVFRRPSTSDVFDACLETGVHTVQVHGVEEPFNYLLESQGLSVYRVHVISPDVRQLPELVPPPSAGRIAVLDAGDGGSGQRFHWPLLGDKGPDHTFVAGGVTPDTVVDLLLHRPFGIDLSSGVESAPGVKDPAKLERLFGLLEVMP